MGKLCSASGSIRMLSIVWQVDKYRMYAIEFLSSFSFVVTWYPSASVTTSDPRYNFMLN
jgi:hypothetical protein